MTREDKFLCEREMGLDRAACRKAGSDSTAAADANWSFRLVTRPSAYT